MRIELYRFPSTQSGTYGVLLREGQPLCVTLEDPWKDNQRNVSCIPAGVYNVVTHNTARFPRVWRLEGVPGRSGILIHAGNTQHDTQGCILVGTGFGKSSITRSREALDSLRAALPGTFTLHIYDWPPPKRLSFFNWFTPPLKKEL